MRLLVICDSGCLYMQQVGAKLECKHVNTSQQMAAQYCPEPLPLTRGSVCCCQIISGNQHQHAIRHAC